MTGNHSLARSIWALAVAFSLLLPGRMQAQDASVLRLATGEISSIENPALQILLEGLRTEQGIVPADGQFIYVTSGSDPFVAIPLREAVASNRLLYMYYRPLTSTHLFLQIQDLGDGRVDVRLWGAGERELRLTPTGAIVEPRSQRTFRLSGQTLAGMSTASDGLSVFETIDCIVRSIGISDSVTSITNAFERATCSDFSTIALTLTFINCVTSLTSLGTANVLGALGCVAGIGKLISCGLANCTGTPGCTSAPGAPTSFSAVRQGTSGVRLSWVAPSFSGTPPTYILDAGSSSGSSNIAANVATNSSATAFTAEALPAGTYFVRVRARNDCGTSGPSNEQSFTIGGGGGTGPGDLQATLTWNSGVDIDLHVIEPNGTEVYYGNLTGPTARLDRDDLDGFGPENIFVNAGQAAAGTYQFFLVQFGGSTPTTSTITIRLNRGTSAEQVVTFTRQTSSGNPSLGFNIANVDIRNGTIREVTTTRARAVSELDAATKASGEKPH